MFFPEQEYRVSTKSEDEVKRLTLEDGLSEVQRSYLILTKGQQLQKRSVYMNLHRILRQQHAFESLFRVIVEEVQQQEEENQVIAAKSLERLIREHRLTPDEQNSVLNLCILILKIWSQPVVDQWQVTTEALLKIMPLEPLLSQLTKTLLSLTHTSQPIVSRSACRLIGPLAEMLGDKIKGPLFERARTMCSDHEKEIRFMLANDVMPRLCLSVSTDLLETYLLEKILELYYDSILEVKIAGMKLFYTIAHKLSLEEQKNRCVKLFVDQIQSQIEESKVLLSRVCGAVYLLISDHMDKNIQTKLLFYSIYKEYAKSKNPAIRVNFAYNFPAILSISQQKFEYFQDSYLAVSSDTNEDVIKQTQSSFHEVVLLSEPSETLIGVFQQWMKSANSSVLVDRFDKVYNAFQCHQQPQFGQSILDFIMILQDKHRWDSLQSLLNQLLACQITIDLDLFLQCFLNCINKGTPSIKRLSALNIANYLSSLTTLRKRKEAILSLIDLLFKSGNFTLRMTFIDLVEGFISKLSKKLFKSYGLMCVLELVNDPVVSVRVRLLKLLPFLKCKIDTEDESQLEIFDDVVQQSLSIDNHSFLTVVQATKNQLLNEIQINDEELLQQEEIVYQNDLKSKVFDEAPDLDYLNKYKKKFSLPTKTKLKISSQVKLQHNFSVKSLKEIQQSQSPVFDLKKKGSISTIKVPVVDQKKKSAYGFKLPSLQKQ